MNERPSPEDLANKAERDAAYWREEERAAIVAWLRTYDGDVFADAIERGDHLVREGITPDAANP